jgi:superfamily II DNA or RNA helicase
MINLRPYQHGAIGNLRTAIASGQKRVLLQAATGAGKTIIACEMIQRATAKSKRVLFIAHRKEIINQTSGKLDAFGIEHGVIMAYHRRVNAHAVQVASIQTLIRRDKPEADLIIIDECHLSVSASFKEILAHYPNATVIGLTATPVRLDGRGLGEIYGDIVQVIPMAKLIAEGHLVKPRVFAPFIPDMKGVKKSKGDYDACETAKLMDRKEITADIVKHWLETVRIDYTVAKIGERESSGFQTNHRKTIVFASSVQHSKNLVSEFTESGISAKHLDATTPATERDQTLQAWRDGKFTVLSNCGLFIEGLDVPAASCCILARPTKSLTIYLQAVGRVMRPHESKADCVILDCAGLTYEHGFVDDHREWTLDGKIKRPKDDVQAVHICEECFAAYSKAQYPNECPECGFVMPVERKAIKTVEVELKELTRADLQKEQRKEFVKAERKNCKTLEDFLSLALKVGYQSGWAYKQWDMRRAWLQSKGYSVPRVAA